MNTTGDESVSANSGQRADRDQQPTGPTLIAPLSSLSLVSGVASFFLLPLVIPALATGLIAMLFGHIAVGQIKNRSNEFLGTGRARIGLILGYGALLFAVILFPLMDQGRLFVRGILASDRTAAAADPLTFSPGVLGTAERKLSRGTLDKRGNTERADELASHARRKIKSYLKDVLQLEGRKGFGWDESGVECYCLDNTGIVFVVYVPDVVGFNDAALRMLHRAAWLSAVASMRDHGQPEPGEEIGVGIMGNRRCETFLIGGVSIENEALSKPKASGGDSGLLAPLLR